MNNYLVKDRKLDAALLDKMGVTTVKHSKMGDVIQFPYLRGGHPYAAKFRTLDKKFSSTRGVSRGVYNEDAISGGVLVITEGEIDCLSCIQAGFESSVSLPDGWTEQGNKIQSLLEIEERLRNCDRVVVAGDNDIAGESLPRSVANLLDGADVRFARWPDGCKDPNDVLVQHGEAVLAEAINTATKIDPVGGYITSLSDLPPMSTRRVLRTGVKFADERIALELGAMSVVTGYPGAGKSTFTTWAALKVAQNENIKVGLFSFETHPYRTRDHLGRLIAGTAWEQSTAETKRKIVSEADKYFRLVHRTYDESNNHNLGWLLENIHTLAVRDQCKLIIIDPWNELEHIPEPGESVTSYINFALQKIRQVAEKLEVHIMVVAHPRKPPQGFDPKGKAVSRAPMGYDIADSAAFYNKPSLGLSVYTKYNDSTGANDLFLVNWKVRDAQLYNIRRGSTEMLFNEFFMSYEGAW